MEASTCAHSLPSIHHDRPLILVSLNGAFRLYCEDLDSDEPVEPWDICTLVPKFHEARVNLTETEICVMKVQFDANMKRGRWNGSTSLSLEPLSKIIAY